MSDVELRDLERKAALGGEADVLVYSRALERAGRRDDAYFALLPSLRHEAVRREISRWRECWPNLDNTNYHDVLPIRSRPRVRWSCRTKSPDRPSARFKVHPLALLLEVEVGPTPHRLHLHDPETGDFRAEVVSLSLSGTILREGTLAFRSMSGAGAKQRATLEGYDVLSGAQLFAGWSPRTSDRVLNVHALASGDLFVCDGKTFDRYSWPSAREAPSSKSVWSRETSAFLSDIVSAGNVLVSEDKWSEGHRLVWVAEDSGEILGESVGRLSGHARRPRCAPVGAGACGSTGVVLAA
jgi:hypothetical protein